MKKNRINAKEKRMEKKLLNKEYAKKYSNAQELTRTYGNTDNETELNSNSTELQLAQSDENIKYVQVYSVIHDKTCCTLKKYSDSHLSFLNEYDKSLQQCPECATRSFIRYAANNINSFKAYEKMFIKNKMTKGVLERLFIDENIKISLSNFQLCVSCKEDKWKIIFERDEDDIIDFTKAYLYHNNYVVNPKGNRVFTKGYHLQNEGSRTLERCFEQILDYSFVKHNNNVKKVALVDFVNQNMPIDSNEPAKRTKDLYDGINNICNQIYDIQSKYQLIDSISEILYVCKKVLSSNDIPQDDVLTLCALKEKYNNTSKCIA